MQTVPTSWENIISERHKTVVRLLVQESEATTVAIPMNRLVSVQTYSRVFGDDCMSVGSCVSGEIDVEFIRPVSFIPPKMARLQVQITVENNTEKSSDWVTRGVYFIDTREEKELAGDNVLIKIHGYDAMLKAEAAFPTAGTMNEKQALDAVAALIGVELDERTESVIDEKYSFSGLDDYSCREVLGFIASAYAGNFVISAEGKLLLIRLNDLPEAPNPEDTDPVIIDPIDEDGGGAP